MHHCVYDFEFRCGSVTAELASTPLSNAKRPSGIALGLAFRVQALDSGQI